MPPARQRPAVPKKETGRSALPRRGLKTREAIIAAAERLFSEKGFVGASLADICAAVSIAKPSLLHHFPAKERLYAVILDRIAASLAPLVETCRATSDAGAGLMELASAIDLWCEEHPDANRIILRDMLDLSSRPAKPHRWPLTFVVETLHEKFEQLPKRGPIAMLCFEAFLAVYLGSICYAHVAPDTLAAMPYPGRPKTWRTQAARDTRQFIRSLVAAGTG